MERPFKYQRVDIRIPISNIQEILDYWIVEGFEIVNYNELIVHDDSFDEPQLHIIALLCKKQRIYG